MTPLFLSVHQLSNNSLDKPLCIIPGLAMTTQGPMSSNSSMFFDYKCILAFIIWESILWKSLLLSLICAWRQRDCWCRFASWFSRSWHSHKFDRQPCTFWQVMTRSKWESRAARDEWTSIHLKNIHQIKSRFSWLEMAQIYKRLK